METVYQEKDHILSVLAQNHTGVLQRISGLFSRRCYNIKSIVAAQTADTGLSEVLIVVTGDGRIVKQVKRQLEKLVDEIESQLQSGPEREIPTTVIGELVMEKLKNVDEVAYVRFASVYKQYQDINSFKEELNNLTKGKEVHGQD